MRDEAEINQEIEEVTKELQNLVPPATDPLSSEPMEALHLSGEQLRRHDRLIERLEALQKEKELLRRRN